MTTLLASQDELPAVQTSRAHAPFEQYSSGLQSVAPTQATQYPRAVSHKRPIFVHCVSEVHFSGLQASPVQSHPAGQSLAPMHSTQRPTSVPQTCPLGQASELTQGVYGLQTLARQSLLVGQSAPTTQATHSPVAVSQALLISTSRNREWSCTGGWGVMHPWSWHLLRIAVAVSDALEKLFEAGIAHLAGRAIETRPAAFGGSSLYGRFREHRYLTPLSGTPPSTRRDRLRVPKAVLPPHATIESIDPNVKHKPTI